MDVEIPGEGDFSVGRESNYFIDRSRETFKFICGFIIRKIWAPINKAVEQNMITEVDPQPHQTKFCSVSELELGKAGEIQAFFNINALSTVWEKI
jgi:hypothetical protein